MSHFLMNMIILTSNCQLNDIKLGKCSVREMKLALQALTVPTYITSSLDCSLDCFLIKQEGGRSSLSNNFLVFFSISACHHLDYKRRRKKN